MLQSSAPQVRASASVRMSSEGWAIARQNLRDARCVERVGELTAAEISKPGACGVGTAAALTPPLHFLLLGHPCHMLTLPTSAGPKALPAQMAVTTTCGYRAPDTSWATEKLNLTPFNLANEIKFMPGPLPACGVAC